MFLRYLFCFSKNKIYGDESEDPELNEINYERANKLPFAWKVNMKNDMEHNIQKLEKINQNGEKLLSSSKKYCELTKELSEKVKKNE
jgi:hypothetical protein